MAEDENLELGETPKASKSKKKIVPLAVGFLLVWALAAVGNYFWLKATWVPPEPPILQHEENQPVTTIDLSDVKGYLPGHSEAEDSMMTYEASSPRVDSLRTAIAELTTASVTRDSLIRALAAAIEEAKKPPPEPPKIAQKTTADTTDVKRSAKLAKIVEAMSPADAAKMLESLPDDMVTYILLRLKQRQAAQIMAALPSSRSAGISRAIMEPMVQVR